MKRFRPIVIPVWIACVFLLPLLIGVLAQGQLGRVLEIEVGKAENAKAQMKLAYVKHFDERNFQTAIAEYRKVIEHFPNSPEAAEAQFRIANVYHWNLIEPEKAIAEYEKVIDHYPETDYAPEAMIRIGEAYGRLYQWNKAIQAFQRVLAAYPNSASVPWAEVKIANGTYFDLNQPQEAQPLYEAILAKYPNTSYSKEAQMWLVRIAYELGQQTAEQAIAAYRQMIAHSPEDYILQSAAQYMIGYTLMHQQPTRDYGQAIVEFRKVLEQYPETYEDYLALTHYYISICYLNLNDDIRAEVELKTALEKHPTTMWKGVLEGQLGGVELWRKQRQALNAKPN